MYLIQNLFQISPTSELVLMSVNCFFSFKFWLFWFLVWWVIFFFLFCILDTLGIMLWTLSDILWKGVTSLGVVHRSKGFPGGSAAKNTCSAGATWDVGSIPGSGDPLEEEMATHPSILAWEIPWTEEPSRLYSIGSQRVGHDRSNLAHTHTRQVLVVACWIYFPEVEPRALALEVWSRSHWHQGTIPPYSV